MCTRSDRSKGLYKRFEINFAARVQAPNLLRRGLILEYMHLACFSSPSLSEIESVNNISKYFTLSLEATLGREKKIVSFWSLCESLKWL